MTSLPLQAAFPIRRKVGSSECGKEAADDSKSEAQLVDVAGNVETFHL